MPSQLWQHPLIVVCCALALLLVGRVLAGGVVVHAAAIHSAEAEPDGSRPVGAEEPLALIYLPVVVNKSARLFEEMVVIPAGAFQMGCAPASGVCEVNEPPVRTVTLARFSIDRFEVTNERYAACVAAGGCTPRNSQVSTVAHAPVGFVTQAQAAAFCAWDKKRLPTEAEWEKAARGTSGNLYPWGAAAPTCDLANHQSLVTGFPCEFGGSVVGSYPDGASPFGLLDMAGNIAEWTSSSEAPSGGNGDSFIIKGGSSASFPSDLRSSARQVVGGEFVSGNFGIRCARE